MNNVKKEKNQQIQVFVRVRPQNAQEKDARSHCVVEVPNSKEITVKQHSTTKKFTFDRAFGPKSKQLDVYSAVVSPLIDEVLAGYNCTVFAYGQTGTGKTYTMAGYNQNLPDVSWQNDPDAGIIPRTLSQLFDEVRCLQVEYTVRVSYLELYNEELFDLLSPTDDSSKLRLFEDTVKKGSVIVHGLEEVIVHSKSEVYKILAKGSEKRQTAATLMNAQSSRSHTIFSITVHTKDNSVEGEDLVKTGKLNLVDLAGSENIGRSGAVDKRAREAGNINQSLLTLGRVITSLVERTPHIPYRESKLTRLLQDSLGGRTKTSIIATISPAICNLEETLSTLEYAHRAKNITNRPEINQRFTKSALLKQYTEEIEKLRRDLMAARACNGIFIAPENYNAMLTEIENYSTDLSDKINEYRAVSEELEKTKDICTKLKVELLETDTLLKDTQKKLIKTTQKSAENKHLVQKHSETEKRLTIQAKELLQTADASSADVYKLHHSLAKRKANETTNAARSTEFQERFNENVISMQEYLELYVENSTKVSDKILSDITANTAKYKEEMTSICQKLFEYIEVGDAVANKFKENAKMHTNTSSKNCLELQETTQKNLLDLNGDIESFIITNVLPTLLNCIDTAELHIKSLNTNHADIQKNLQKTSGDAKQFLENSQHRLLALQKYANSSNAELQMEIKLLKDSEKRRKEHLAQYLEATAEEDNIWTQTINHLEEKLHAADKETTNQIKTEIQHKASFINSCDSDLANIQDGLTKSFNELEIVPIALTESFKGLAAEQETYVKKVKDKIMQNVQQHYSQVQTLAEDTAAITTSQMRINSVLCTNMSNFHNKTQEVLNHVEISNKICTDTLTQDLSYQDNLAVEFKDNLTHELHNRNREVKKHFTEDIALECAPTGATPNRREFQYPRYLASTSPHERILKRFRATHQQCSVDEPPTDAENGVLTNYNDNSVEQNRVLVKSASVNDIHAGSGDTLEGNARKVEDKENTTVTTDLMRSYSDAKLPVKIKGKTTRILGPRNIPT